jgi:hypothetical protein
LQAADLDEVGVADDLVALVLEAGVAWATNGWRLSNSR